MMIENQRKFSRIPVRLEVELHSEGQSYRFRELLNLGLGGCLLAACTTIDPGASCRLQIFLGNPGQGPVIEIDGKICRSDAGAIAIQFTRIDPDSLFHLRNVIRYNSPDADIVDNEIRRHPGIR